MRYFRLKENCGVHYTSDGKKHTAGSIIATESDMHQRHPNRFEEVPAEVADALQKSKKPVAPKAPTPSTESSSKSDDSAPASTQGKDVTDSFENCEENALKVFRLEDKTYNVLDTDTGKLVNKKPLKKVAVQSAIDEYVGED